MLKSPSRENHIPPSTSLVDNHYLTKVSSSSSSNHHQNGDYLSLEYKNGKIPKIIYNPLPDEPDFNLLVEEHGYIKARQLLKLASLRSHQARIKKSEQDVMKSHEIERVREAIRLSSTLGEPSMSSGTTEKILDITSESIIRHDQDKQVEPTGKFVNDNETALFRSLANCDGNFVIAQSGLDSLPSELGNTLFLQTSFLRSISFPRNHLTNLFSIQSCQLASIHFRYVTDLNLADNNLVALPEDIGNMVVLQTLDISSNTLSKLPSTFKDLKSLTKLNVHRNRFSDLDISFGNLTNLTNLNISENQFIKLPAALAKLINLTYLDVADNLLPHLAIIPHVLGPSHLWQQIVDLTSGKKVFFNVITKERYQNIAKHNPASIENDPDIHIFQSKNSLKAYRRRRLWLSICNVPEWESVMDVRTGWSYYRNNVSGTTQWEMPPEIDLIGSLKKLETFILSNNNVRLLPPSLAMMKNLKKAIFSNNRLIEIPNHIHHLSSIEQLKLDHNELKILPSSICQCISLKELYVQSNQIIRLPDQLGTLPNLEVLDVSVNRLKVVSYSLGFCSSLKTLSLYENPLTDPPIEELNKGIDTIKWYLRNRSDINQYDKKPPAMTFHHIGIMNEVSLIESDYQARIHHLVELAKRNHGIMNLQFMGLAELPNQMTSIMNIKRLQLDYNPDLKLQLGFVDGYYLNTVRVMSIRSCNISSLPENLSKLRKLRILNGEINNFEFIPSSVFELKVLQHLDLSKNRIYAISASIDKLWTLKNLNLESNNLEVIPDELGNLPNLINLNLSRNMIQDIPSKLCELKALKKLCLSANCLYYLPKDIRNMNLVDLRIDHNRIEVLVESLFSYELGKSIKYFDCTANNLLDLPNSIYLIDAEANFYADYNPLISPPAYLLNEGLSSVQKYLKYRQIRTEELEDLLHDNDFIFIRSCSKPIVCEVLDDGLGFLTPDDIDEFDNAVDSYLNGEYYNCPSSPEEIVKSLVELRDERESKLYLTILETFIRTLRNLLNSTDDAERKMFNDSVLTTSTRPWGQDNEECNVYVISLSCLLKDISPNPLHRNGRPSVFSLLSKAIPSMPFPFTVELLKDCLRLYYSPYGQVADTERYIFPSCDCYDERRRRPCMHSPCEKPAVVIVQTIYTDDEATFREIEEDEYFGHFHEITTDIRAWLRTKEGRHELEKEVTRRRTSDFENLHAREELVIAEENKLKSAQEAVKKWTRRKQLFQSGASFEQHGLYDIDEAVRNIALEEEKIVRCANRADALRESVVKLNEDLKKELKDRRKVTEEDLLLKYCANHYNATIKVCRQICAMKKIRRPWDGVEGEHYLKWVKSFVPPPDYEEVSIEKALDSATEAEMAKRVIEIGPEYNWEDTDDMTKYHLPIYDRFQNRKNRKA